MLTKEEIRNLRIGDEIYYNGELYEVYELTRCTLEINKSAGNDYVVFHHDENLSQLSLNPPKKKKKFWKWAIKFDGYALYETDDFLDDNLINSIGILGVDCNDKFFRKKLEYTEIEVE